FASLPSCSSWACRPSCLAFGPSCSSWAYHPSFPCPAGLLAVVPVQERALRFVADDADRRRGGAGPTAQPAERGASERGGASMRSWAVSWPCVFLLNLYAL